MVKKIAPYYASSIIIVEVVVKVEQLDMDYTMPYIYIVNKMHGSSTACSNETSSNASLRVLKQTRYLLLHGCKKLSYILPYTQYICSPDRSTCMINSSLYRNQHTNIYSYIY